MDPLPGVVCRPDPKNPRRFHAIIKGPAGSPYEDGLYKLQMFLDDKYPMHPPKCRFLTRIYHPNIDRLGRICLGILSEMWSPSLQLQTVLRSIHAVLLEPNLQEAIEHSMERHFTSNRTEALEQAEKWNAFYATADGSEPGHINFLPCLVLQVSARCVTDSDSRIAVQAWNLAGDIVADTMLDFNATIGDLRGKLFLLVAAEAKNGPARHYDAAQFKACGPNHGLQWFGPPDTQFVHEFSHVRLLAHETEVCDPDNTLLTDTGLL